jgi:large subunit ribosomal protein L24
MMEATGDKRPVQTTEASIQLSDVRLVHPLYNPETNVRRDVIIKELEKEKVPENSERFWGPKVEKRYIAGVEPREYIPFPKVRKPKYQDHDGDTLRIEIDEWTWTPTLLGPPMPPTVIDELRNKYSVFRDRHDDEYIQKKEEGVAIREDWKRRKAEVVLTPLQEFNRKERAEKRRLGWSPLDQGTMEKIGQVMARNGAKVAQLEKQTS